MDGGFDEGGDTADGVEGGFGVEVLEAAGFGGVGAPGEVGAVGGVLFVACDCYFFFVKGVFGGGWEGARGPVLMAFRKETKVGVFLVVGMEATYLLPG